LEGRGVDLETAPRIHEWVVYSARQMESEENNLKLVGKVKKRGFETKFTVPAETATGTVIVEALDTY
jgi:hypothetical protein